MAGDRAQVEARNLIALEFESRRDGSPPRPFHRSELETIAAALRQASEPAGACRACCGTGKAWHPSGRESSAGCPFCAGTGQASGAARAAELLRSLWIAANEFRPDQSYESEEGDNLIRALDEADEFLEPAQPQEAGCGCPEQRQGHESSCHLSRLDLHPDPDPG